MPSIFHDRSIQLTIEVHEASIKKHAKAPNEMCRDAFFALTHDAIGVHRATGVLVDAGWPAPAAALLRTLMDMNVSALALANSQSPPLAAFRYLYTGLRRHSRDQALPGSKRKQMFQQIRERLQQLPGEMRQQAIEVVKEKDRAYWFAPEWPNPGSIIEEFGSTELRWVYNQFSATAHGSFLGMRLHRENPDQMSINPEKSAGPRGLLLDFSSCRFLLELCRIRAVVEGIDLVSDVDALIKEISEAALSFHDAWPPPSNTF